MQEKRDNIAFLNAKNCAAQLLSGKDWKFEDFEALVEKIYMLAPKSASTGQIQGNTDVVEEHRYDKGALHKITPKQIDFIKKLAAERDIEVPDLENLTSFQASKQINELKKFPLKQKTNSQIKAEDASEYDYGNDQ